jgi:hypothetical protein
MYLCNPKQKILSKENEKDAKFKPEEKIQVFLNFQNSNVKVTFVPVQTHKTSGPVEVKPIDPEVDNERKNIIDAVVVRIMKARKTEKHNQLIEDVIR